MTDTLTHALPRRHGRYGGCDVSAKIVGRVHLMCECCHKRPPVRIRLCAHCWGPVVYGDDRIPPFPAFADMLRAVGSTFDLLWLITHRGQGWRLAP